jgi:hypothetical protein
MGKKKQSDPITREFSGYEEAADFWDAHDATDYSCCCLGPPAAIIPPMHTRSLAAQGARPDAERWPI